MVLPTFVAGAAPATSKYQSHGFAACICGTGRRCRAVRLARYCARNPVALRRLEYRSDDATVTYHSDKPTGLTAGSETLDVLEFLASGGVGWGVG